MLKSFKVLLFLVFVASIDCFFVPHPGSKSKDFLILKKCRIRHHHFSDNQNLDDEDEGFVYKKGTETYDDVCGKENAPRKRIVGGVTASPHQFPWMVAFQGTSKNDSWFCSSSLISNQFLLTAAHCLTDAESFLLLLGSHDILKDFEPNRIVVKSVQPLIHPKFEEVPIPDHPGRFKSMKNDIALIKMDKAIPFTEFVRPICLPSYTDATNSFVGENTMAAGWGKMGDFPFAPPLSPELQYVEKLPIMSVETCKQTFDIVSNDSICISSEGPKGVCHGDSGGPLSFKKKDNRYFILGTTSFGRSFCDEGGPQVFTRVAHKKYLRWIETVTQIKIND